MEDIIERLVEVFAHTLRMLQEEIEENKENLHTYNETKVLADDWNNIVDSYFLRKKENYISKEKIQEKIDKLEREFNFYAGREHEEWQDGEFDGEICDSLGLQIKVLKELLSEEVKENDK